jgi:hypothetical protein
MVALPFAALFGLAVSAPPSAEPVTLGFRLVNAGTHRIRAVHVSASRDPGWGENLLGRGLQSSARQALQKDGLKPGQRIEVSLTGPCGLYDVRIVAEKGTEFVEDEVELCEADDVVTVGTAELRRVRAH